MMHSDDKGLVISPRVAEIQIIIVPIIPKKSEELKIMKKVNEIKDKLVGDGLRVDIDDSNNSPGFKFNEWEMKGVPLRIEIGPRDIKDNQVMTARRDNKDKQAVKIKDLNKKVVEILDDIHNSLYKKAKKFLKDNTVEVKTFSELKKAIEDKKIVKTSWSGNQDDEEAIKDGTGGAKILCIVDNNPKGKCVYSGKKANHTVFIAKSY